MADVERLYPKTGGPTPERSQCEFPLNWMSPQAEGPWQKVPEGSTWRKERYKNSRKNPEFCTRSAAVRLGEKRFCNSHAGQILLAQHLGEPHPPLKASE